MACAFGTLFALVFFAALITWVGRDPRFRKSEQAAESNETCNVTQQPGRLEYITLLVGILTLVGLGIYTDINYRLYQATRAQFEVSERPWVNATLSLTSGLGFNQNGGSLSIQATLDITGHSPAIGVWPRVALIPYRQHSQDIDFRKQERRLCEELDASTAQQPGLALFPDAPPYVMPPRSKNITVQDVRKSTDKNGCLSLALIGCVHYKTTFTTDWHHTTFSYGVIPSSTGQCAYGAISAGTIPISNLGLAILMFPGAFSAD